MLKKLAQAAKDMAKEHKLTRKRLKELYDLLAKKSEDAKKQLKLN